MDATRSLNRNWRLPDSERRRVQILESYALQRREPDRQLQMMVRHAAELCGTPMALVSIVESERQWFPVNYGLDLDEVARAAAFCDRAMHGDDVMIVPDAREDSRFFDNPLVRGAPHLRFYAGVPLKSPEGAPLGTLCVVDTQPHDGLTDIQLSGLRAVGAGVMALLELGRVQAQGHMDASIARAAIDDGERRLAILAEAMPQIVWSTDAGGQVDYLNGRWAAFTGMKAEEPLGEGWLEAVHEGDRAHAMAVWNASVEQGVDYEIEYRLRHVEDGYRWVLARGVPMRDENGEVLCWFGTCTDIDGHKQSEEALATLSQELSHRIKNIFSVIAGMVSLTARKHPEWRPVCDELKGRLIALGRAHDFVRAHGACGGPDMAANSLQGLIRQLMKPYDPEGEGVITLTCPDIGIDDRSATPLALCLHELATNACKYGALSQPHGRVSINVSEGGQEVALLWRESGGPSAMPPKGRGLGHELIEISIVRQLGGRIDYDWEADGLSVRAALPRASLRR